MKYENLQELLAYSSTTRAYFLSLPVSTQHALHEYNSLIHSAAELHYFQISLKQYRSSYSHSAVHRWDI